MGAIALDTRLGCLEEEQEPACLAMVGLVHAILQQGKVLDGGLRLWEVGAATSPPCLPQLLPSAQFREFHRSYAQFSGLAKGFIGAALERCWNLGDVHFGGVYNVDDTHMGGICLDAYYSNLRPILRTGNILEPNCSSGPKLRA